jgi:signal transduction histidine kinase
VNPARRLQQLLVILFGASLALTVLLLVYLEHGSIDTMQALSDRVASFDKQRLEQEFAEKSLDLLSPLASQVQDGALDLDDQVKGICGDAVLRALFAKGKPSAAKLSRANGKAKPENLSAALTRLAEPKKGQWISAEITDKEGRVLASWPAGSPADKDLKSDPLFAQMKSGATIPGLPVRNWVKLPQAKAGAFQSLVAEACGFEDLGENFAGMLRVLAPAQSLYGLDPQRSLKPIFDLSPKASVILQRGSGEQLLNSAKGPYLENSALIPDLKDAMAAMQAKPADWVAIKSYDGKPAVLSWRRVGSWGEGQGAANLINLLLVMPENDIKTPGSALPGERPAHFYARPLALLLLFLAFGLPLGLGFVLLQGRTEPLRRTMETASQIDEFGAAPEGLEFPEGASDFGALGHSLNALLRRAAASEHRAHELDLALRRVEDQASRDATTAAQELSELRGKLAGAESEKAAANTKFDASQKARAEAEAQLGNLRSALETAQRSIDLKNSENKNLSSQIQDLMRTLEEQRKVAQQVQESSMRRDDELVRLSAVNTLSSELKATLTVIKNYISTMLGSAGAISDAQQEFLGVVINKSARLERLIADLMEISEIGSGIKPPRMEVLTAASLVQEALLNTRPQADHKKIALEFAESGNVPSISVDKERFGGVVRALLSQAVKVTSRGERVSLLVGTRENNVELRFSDPGMSLPPDRAAKVFNQFHGVDSQAGPEFIGTGLRFPIMRAVVEAHGGKIWIESQVGRGKTFVISIPKAGAFTPPPTRALPPGLGVPAAPGAAASKPDQGEVAKFDSIFGEMPALAGAPAVLAPLGAPPAGIPAPPPKPSLGGLPPLGSPPAPPPLAGLPPLAPPQPVAPVIAPPRPLGPPPAPTAVPAPPPPGALATPSGPLVFKTEAAKAPLKDEDKSNFDAIFGAPPAQASEAAKPGALPKVELKTGAALGEADKASFEAIFGGGPAAAPAVPPKPLGPPPSPGAVPAPPPPAAKPAVPADLANFDAIFGGAPSGAPPVSPPPKPLGPPPSPGAVPAPPPPAAKPAVPADLANFDAIFGGGAAPSGPTPPGPTPSGLPAPPPAKPAGGLNTMDDLKNMLGGL